MDRRSFFRTMIGGVAATAAVRAFPFRVFSFPSEVVAPTFTPVLEGNLANLTTVYYNKEALEQLKKNLTFQAFVEVEESERRVRRLTGKTDLSFFRYELQGAA